MSIQQPNPKFVDLRHGGRYRRELTNACYRLLQTSSDQLADLPTHFGGTPGPHFYLAARQWAIENPGADLIEIQLAIVPDSRALAVPLLSPWEEKLGDLFPLSWAVAAELLKNPGPTSNDAHFCPTRYQILFNQPKSAAWVPDLRRYGHKERFNRILAQELAYLDLSRQNGITAAAYSGADGFVPPGRIKYV